MQLLPELDRVLVAVTGSDDSAVRIWDLATGTEWTVLYGYHGPVKAVACVELDGIPDTADKLSASTDTFTDKPTDKFSVSLQRARPGAPDSPTLLNDRSGNWLVRRSRGAP